ncbi:MAG: Crp/Fnr family transcriptional regulator [Acidobacteriota bacterium]|nr:Crp/Fnr family transcriptional regulator [Acidobacteriota bacterium]
MANVRAEGNLLLRVLSDAELEKAGVRSEDHEIRSVLIDAEETPDYVFFPHRGGVASIVRATTSGQMVEAGVVGHEGFFNVHALLTSPAPTGSQAVVQNDGRFSRIEVKRVRELFESNAVFRDALLAYTSVFLDQVTQNLVCNRLHPIEQRLAKWLLMMRDRVPSDSLHVTQEFLGHMLGVHRPGVSIAVSALENDGLIQHRRNWLALRNREGVLLRSCECYRPLQERLTRFASALV